MIDLIYLAQADFKPELIEEKTIAKVQESGLMHSKVVGRFETVQEPLKQTDNIDDIFSFIDIYGTLRFAYIKSAHKISPKPNKLEKQATAVGGELGFNTAEFYGFSLHATAYASQSVNFLNPSKDDLNEDFFAKNLDSFVYLGEASLDYSSDAFQARLGRIKVETPYANSDDIRMAANTFEGASIDIQHTSKLKTEMIFLKRWAGYDSQDEDAGVFQNEFKNLVDDESFGMAGTSFVYEYAKNSELTFWYNYVDKMSIISYLEAAGRYFINGDFFHLDYGFQASNIQELSNSNVDGNVLGIMSIVHYQGVFFGGAYNVAIVDDGKYITNGFGGGPYYTSLDEATLAAISEALPGDKAESYRVGVGYEFENLGVNGLVIELAYGELYNEKASLHEKDVILTYEIADTWYLNATYTNYESSSGHNSFDRALVRLDFRF